jgi:catechol-2,3-dioxygenase
MRPIWKRVINMAGLLSCYHADLVVIKRDSAECLRNLVIYSMKPRISKITLRVRDLAVAIAFYAHGLGFPRMKSPPEVALFTLNGT